MNPRLSRPGISVAVTLVMRDDDDDYYAVTDMQAWAYAEGARDERHDEEAEAAAAAIQRRIGKDRLISMWRTAVGSVGEIVKAEHERDRVSQDRDQPRAKPTGWGATTRSLAN